MIRIVLYLLLVIALGLGAAWLADRPGQVILTWQGWRVSTSVTVALAAFMSVIALSILIWSLVRFFLHAPGNVSMFFRERRRARGWRAISRGMIAVGSGNLQLARKSARDAQKILGHEPLALLLAAQAAQLDGDSDRAEAEFRAMLEQPETRLLGLRGLYVEARRRNDPLAARQAAQEAATSDARVLWASEALLEFQCLAGDWEGALGTVEREAGAKTIDKVLAKRRRAVLYTARAMTLEPSDEFAAHNVAREAVKLAPALVPAAALAGRLEARRGSLRKATRIVEKAWLAQPHPELAEAWLALREQDSAPERLKRLKTLAKKTPGDPEAALAVARAALEAHDFLSAREALAPHLSDPTQAMCLTMAEIEQSEHGDHGKAREWTARAFRARRDPAWVADGFVSERWLPASPATGRLDAFEWRAPPITPAGPILEHVAEQGFAPARAAPEIAKPEIVKPTEDILLVPEDARPKRVLPRPAAPVVAEPPLPDDPGLEPEPDNPPRAKSGLLSRLW